jgi:hypothetical protein
MKADRAIGISLATWELVALITGKPAITDVVRRYPALEVAAVVLFVAHCHEAWVRKVVSDIHRQEREMSS